MYIITETVMELTLFYVLKMCNPCRRFIDMGIEPSVFLSYFNSPDKYSEV